MFKFFVTRHCRIYRCVSLVNDQKHKLNISHAQVIHNFSHLIPVNRNFKTELLSLSLFGFFQSTINNQNKVETVNKLVQFTAINGLKAYLNLIKFLFTTPVSLNSGCYN